MTTMRTTSCGEQPLLEVGGLEPREARPEAEVGVTGLLRLQADQVDGHLLDGRIGPLDQVLADEQGAAEHPAVEGGLGHASVWRGQLDGVPVVVRPGEHRLDVGGRVVVAEVAAPQVVVGCIGAPAHR